MLSKILKTIGILVALLLIIVLFNTLTYKSKQLQLEAVPPVAVTENCVQHLSGATAGQTRALKIFDENF